MTRLQEKVGGRTKVKLNLFSPLLGSHHSSVVLFDVLILCRS